MSTPFGELLEQIGAKTPAPGGGFVTGATGALGAALGTMVVRFSLGKSSLKEYQEDLESALESLDKATQVLVLLGDEDAEAYARVNQLEKLDEADERKRELPEAVREAVRVPMSVIINLCDVLGELEGLCGRSNPHLRSDLAIAAILVEAGARASIWNVRVNEPLLKKHGLGWDAVAEAEQRLAEGADRLKRILEACAGGA